VLVFLAPARGRAEVLDEFWPELDLWYSFSQSTRALLTVAGGRSREDGDRADAELALYLDYRASKRISYRVGYLQTIDSSSEDEGVGEQRALFDFNYRWHFGSSTELADRTRLELRDLGNEDSVRIRNRLRVQSERQVRQVSVSPYASLEAYYDDRYHSVSRWRVETGFTMPSGRHLEWDFYLGWQQDRRPESDSLTGLGITLNVK
jgi:hypothetical protein